MSVSVGAWKSQGAPAPARWAYVARQLLPAPFVAELFLKLLESKVFALCTSVLTSYDYLLRQRG
jgi:hypothetical protein